MQIPFGVFRIVIFFVFSLVCRLGLAQATYPVQVFYFDYAADCRTVQTLGAVYDKGRVRITWYVVHEPIPSFGQTVFFLPLPETS